MDLGIYAYITELSLMFPEITSPAAISALSKFEQSKTPKVWKQIDKKALVSQIRMRLENPFQIHQGKETFSGTAAIVFELARQQPVRYVEICRELYETGAIKGDTMVFRASEKLRQSHPRLRMNPVEWMILSTMRESESRFFSSELDAPEVIRNVPGLTKSWEMKGWVKELLGYKQIKYHNTLLYGELDALQDAARAIADGGVAFGLITSQGLFGTEQPFLPTPNHWVSIIENVSTEGGEWLEEDSIYITLDVYSWGKKLQIKQDESMFEDYFWGLVIGLR
ncbi:MAG: hypothetical protein AAF378_07850 [Cyanobacteria bacterium P01_A01_bin.84]